MKVQEEISWLRPSSPSLWVHQAIFFPSLTCHTGKQAAKRVLTRPSSRSEYQNPGPVSWPGTAPHLPSLGPPHFSGYLDVLGHHANVPAGGQEAVDGAGQVDPEPLAEKVSS